MNIGSRIQGKCRQLVPDGKGNDVARMNVALSIAKIELAYFNISPDTGTQDCVCSYCGFVIGENEVPLRMFRKSDNTEARLCENCQGLLNKQIVKR